MKGRSYRFSGTEPHEDWVDGSWTVDCVCGVNFDDGEEMVNCDECGVWVHTRCSRYVKGDELFTCDKCKNKNNVNDSEETEVAQLLVELPTKTFRMENSYGRSIPLRRPFRLWTEIPMEERVHVQGVPGGDPALFEGLSSVFSRELWKSSGYVPKKFNIKYREFPCWDEKDRDEIENTCESGHQAENGAGVLFSMSKENVVAAPASALVGTRGLSDKEVNLKLLMKDNKNWNSSEVGLKRPETGLKKEKSLLRPVITEKRKKEELEASRDRIKKKVKVTDKEADEKKGLVRKSAFQPTSDSKPLESRKDRDPHASNGDAGNIKNEKSKETNFEESIDCGLTVNNADDMTSNMAISVECSKGVSHSDGHVHGTRNQDDKSGHHVRIVLKSSGNNDPLFQERKDVINNQAKEERHSKAADTSEDNAEGSIGISVKPSVGCADGAAPEVEGKRFDDVNGNMLISTGKDELLNQLDDATTGGAVGQQALGPVDCKGAGTCAAGTSDIKIMAPSSSHADDLNMQSFDRASVRVSVDNMDKSDDLSSYPSQVKRDLLPSEGSVSAQKDSTESKPEHGLLQEPSKSSKPFPAYSKPKMVVCIGKSLPSAAGMPKSYSFDNLKHPASQNSIPDSKQEPHADHANVASSYLVKEKDRDDVSRKALKEHPKYSSSRSMQQGRVSHSSLSKRSMPESVAASSSSKASSAPTTTGSAEATGSLQSQYASQLQNKQSCSGIPQKSEKHSQPICQSSAKNPAQSTQSLAPSSSAALSDEELALLLHQELNSSPRVPRVPRMRQPGSLPQLASPAATSLLLKRTSSSGSKDHVSASRRKNKDASKDGFRSSRDIDDNKGIKSYKVHYSPDWKSQDNGSRGSMCTKGEENEPAKSLHSSRKVLPPSSTTSTSSGPCSSNEVNEHSMPSPHSSPRNTSDDAPVHQTLPGLINEIMSKGKRMTYEELCNAVLPHWPHLRKHNGERYAYSSHSQAVLDCLRNRHEWARLVDRGPKTNATRKKRKTDAEESDDNESSKRRERDRDRDRDERGGKQREDFPKGKRKARKRRRPALQGKDMKDVRKKQKEEMSDEDEEGAFSDSDSGSSDESISSEASVSSEEEKETATPS